MCRSGFSPFRWISGAGDPRTKLHLVMGKSDPENPDGYKQQSVVIVPADAPGVRVVRPMEVFGYDDAPEGHCEVIYENVRVPLNNLVLGWGRGFEVCYFSCAVEYQGDTYPFRSFKDVLGLYLFSLFYTDFADRLAGPDASIIVCALLV